MVGGKRNHVFVAFLRGINVGGKNSVNMGELREAFASMGFTGVSTVMATGNVIFGSSSSDVRRVCKKLEEGLAERFGRRIGLTVRSSTYLRKLVDAEPFGNSGKTAGLKLYVTFVPEQSDRRISIPRSNCPDGVTVALTTGGEIFSVVDLNRSARTPDLMSYLEREAGPQITTRGWSTIQKILGKLKKD
jgi:uncharacterized protein (DUF1697 family)